MRAMTGILALAALVGCKDSNVPFYTEPTSVPNSQVGIQNAVTGLFAASRIDVGTYIYYMSGFARDAAQLANVNPENTIFETGLGTIPTAGVGLWDNPYRAVGEALQIIQTLPATDPAYTPAQLNAAVGVVQTIEALNLMIVAETHDTLGMPIHATPTGPGPAYCIKDVWQYIVALLDSANNSLNAAGSVAIPFNLPPGFAAFQGQASPSTTPGTFAAVNRALAGKAGLELAYAIARANPGTHPTPTTPGNPDITALTRADSAVAASSIYDPTSLGPSPTGGWTEDASGVFWDFSAQSGDLVNPINQNAGIWVILKTFAADVDTVNDLRWTRKFGPDPYPLQLPNFDSIATLDAYTEYGRTSSPIPILRDEGLVLIRAQIQLGLNHLATALTYINDVRTSVGGLPPVSGADYITVRNLLLKEQRPSLVFESSGDRTIALRMYHLEAVADTTWHSQDLHTTVVPVEQAEIEGRNGSYTLTCP